MFAEYTMIHSMLSLGMALPALWIASAATWATCGEVAGVHVVGGVVTRRSGTGSRGRRRDPGTGPTELFVDTTSLIIRDISMMPRTRIMSSGVTMAASTATAPRSRRRIRATKVNTAALLALLSRENHASGWHGRHTYKGGTGW